jgi:hypothetical protein
MTGSAADFFRRGGNAARTRPVFTNRVVEVGCFERALTEHRLWCEGLDPMDQDVGRRNVLNFYGIGGMGKSTLLAHLGGTLASREPRVVSVTLDFEDTVAYDLEQVLLRIRSAVGEHGNRCVAFDFAFSFYWNVAHPGTTLETYTKANGWLARAADKVGLSSSIEASVMEVASSIASSSGLAHGAARLAHSVGKIVYDRTKVRHAVANCEPLPLFLDAGTVVDNVSYLPSLLAWDLHRAGNPPVIVFVDTYEELTARGRKYEQVVQRVVRLLPNVLFVIAGRNSLDWDNDNLVGVLDNVGTGAWPELAATKTLVGDLSDLDSDRYLRERLVTGDHPAIPSAVRAKIVAAAAGWPLYLEIAASECQQALHENRLDLTDFDLSFPALVSRIAQDLAYDERRVLRAAALIASFDPALVRAGAGAVDHATVTRVLARDFVKLTPEVRWPYSLHQALRATLIENRHDDDFWGPDDWQAAAARVLEEMGRRVRTGTDRIELSRCLLEGLRLSHAYRIESPWLSEAGRLVDATGGLTPIQDLGSVSTHAGALSKLLRCKATLHQYSYRDQPARLEDCVSDKLSDDDLFWLRSMQASSWMSAGELERAEYGYRQILAQPVDGALGDEAMTMYALLFLKRGAFSDLIEFVGAHDDRINEFRLRGDVCRFNAHWPEAEAYYLEGLRRAEIRSDAGLAALFRAELALVDGWRGIVDPARWQVDDDGASAPWDVVASHIASALFMCTRDLPTALRRLDRAATVASQFGFEEASADVLIARAFINSVISNVPETQHCRDLVSLFVDRSGTYASWLEVIDLWQGDVPAEEHSDVQWVDGRGSAHRTWNAILVARREQR